MCTLSTELNALWNYFRRDSEFKNVLFALAQRTSATLITDICMESVARLYTQNRIYVTSFQ